MHFVTRRRRVMNKPTESATENTTPIRSEFSDVMEVSVKWWCKRPPAVRVTASAWQTLHGARPNKNTDCLAMKGCSLFFSILGTVFG